MNKFRGGTQITLGDKEYNLAPTFEAMMAFEERAKVAIIEVNNNLIKDGFISMRIATAAIWSGILGDCSERGKEETAPTFNQVGAMCVSAGFSKIAGPVTSYIMSMLASDEDRESLYKAQQEEEEKEKKKAEKKQRAPVKKK